MALSGSLEELGVLDIVQFVNQAHLSGTLALKSGTEEAALFYRKGGLVHASLGSLTGVEVLVQIVDWTTGSFEFRAGEETGEETIRMDLHRAVMYALKTRDERKLEAEQRKAQQTPPPPAKPSPREQLTDAIAPLEFLREVSIFDAGGVLVAAGRGGGISKDSSTGTLALSNTVVALNNNVTGPDVAVGGGQLTANNSFLGSADNLNGFVEAPVLTGLRVAEQVWFS